MDCFYDDSEINETYKIPLKQGDKQYIYPSFQFGINKFDLQSLNSNENGGAMKLTLPNIQMVINNTIYRNNYANISGGALYYDIHFPLFLNNCSFVNNSSNSDGGSVKAISTNGFIYISNSTSKESKSFSYGGTFDLSSTNISLNNVSITDSFSNSAGGSLHLTGNILDLKNVFTHNSNSTSNGGSSCLNSSEIVLIENYTSSNTNSKSQVGTSFISSPNCNISNSWLEYSNSTMDGGSIYITSLSNQTYYIKNCYFGFTYSLLNGGSISILRTIQSSNIFISECSFFKTMSLRNGGAIHINCQFLKIDISKICCDQCFIGTSGSTYKGTSIYISSNQASTLMIKFESITSSKGGLSGFGDSTFYLLNSQHFSRGINFSQCRTNIKSCAHLLPRVSSTYQYYNLLNCTSTSINFMYIDHQLSNTLVEISHSNIIGNQCTSYGFEVYSRATYAVSITFSIFLQNSVSTLLGETWGTKGLTRNCFFHHIGTLALRFDHQLSFETTSHLTETHILTHYSTYLCNTPNELGHLEIVSCSNCQTMPLIPSTCFYESNIEFKFSSSIYSIFQIMYISLILIE